MFLDFLLELKKSKLPVSITEFLTFISSLNFDLIDYDIDNFYYLARAALVKDEKLIDRFDIIFGQYFKAMERIQIDHVISSLDLPSSWMQKIFRRYFSKEEIEKIKSDGDFKKLLDTFKKRLNDQKKKHQGGNKWIGTMGTSPYGSYGYNPEGIRISQNSRRFGKAVKVWDKRIFKDFDSENQLDTRGFQIALKRLRQWAETGVDEELDIEQTITQTSKNGYLDIKTKKERENSIKILLFLDVGGSMDSYVKITEQLFNAAKSVFKNIEQFYFHNCLYEQVWKHNERRWEESYSTLEILRTYGRDYKCIFVGDATMSPYEILLEGGGNEHYNNESGKTWLERTLLQWPSSVWINPTPNEYWQYTDSIQIIKEIFDNKMVPLTLDGLDEATKILK